MKKLLLSFVAILALSISSFAQLFDIENTGMAESRGIIYMHAIDANIVWAAAYDGTAPTNPCVDVVKTIDGGTTWSQYNIGTTAVCIANLTAVDENKCWAQTYSPTGANTPNDGVWYTANGGTTWTHQTTALFSNSVSFPDCIYFWDANNGWCMGDPINGDFEIYTTTNGGTTWTAVPGGQIPNPQSGEFGVVGYFGAVGDTVWFGTNEGRIYRSIDKGHNWTVSAIAGWTAIYVHPYMKNAQFGMAMDQSGTLGALAQTTDGGTTWTPITPTGTLFSNDMRYVPGTASTWVVTGADITNALNGVNYSMDDCASFTLMPGTDADQYLATSWINDSTGWIGGFVTGGVGGMYKFNSVLALQADFMSPDTNIVVLDSAHFTNLSMGEGATYLWTFQGGIPPSSTLKTPPPIVYLQQGSWNVTLRVTNNLGVSTLTKPGYIFVDHGIGINEHSKSSVTVYPNPVKDNMNISATSRIQEIQVINLIGQVVLTQQVNNTMMNLNISELNAGIYNLKVKMTDGYIYKKIVVE